jgi:hypothetical protein
VLLIVFAIVFPGVLCFALSQCGYGLEEDFPLDEAGTTNTNMHLYGGVVEKDGWIYYANPKDADRLYRRSLDGTVDEQMHHRDHAYYLNVIGNRIWYIRGAAGGPVYELRLGEDGRVYRERKLDSRPCGDLMSAGGYLFYIVYPEEGDRWFFGDLYRLDLRSGEKRLLEKDVSSYGIHEGNIYFGHRPGSSGSGESNGVLCKMDFSGDGYTILAGDDSYNIEILDDTVYYVAGSEDWNVYSIKTDGSERWALPEDWRKVYITDRFIYYSRQYDDEDPAKPLLWRMNHDGSGDTGMFADSREVAVRGITEHAFFFRFRPDYLERYVSDPDGGNIRPWP